MSKTIVHKEGYTQSDLDQLFQRADKQWELGHLKSAFRLFLLCAKAGDSGCQVNLGTFYRDGIGVRSNRERAIYWYHRAYRQGLGGAASNLGVLYRDEGRAKQAVQWFERAKDGDADLAIALIYLQQEDMKRAKHYLKRASNSPRVTEASRDQARELLEDLDRRESCGNPDKPEKPGDRRNRSPL